MVKTHQFRSFAEFWPFYLGEHRHAISRLLHYSGTLGASLLFFFLLLNQLWTWLPLVLIAGYAPAWIGHFFIEKNRPATFRHPLWSFMGDYKMLYLAITGSLAAELAQLADRKHANNLP